MNRPLRDNPELELAARQELDERAGAAEPDELEAIQRRFGLIDEVPAARRRLLYWLPIVLAVLAVFGAGIPAASSILGLRSLTRMPLGSWFGPTGFSPLDRLESQLSPDDRLFVFGDTSQPTDDLAAKALWESQPENPALFAEYLRHCDPLPSDFLETANRIDPDNAWFLLVAAGELAEGCVKRTSRPYHGDPEKLPLASDWEVTPEGDFQKALDLLREAGTLPKVEHYSILLLRQRLEILPPEHDLQSRLARIYFTANTSTKDHWLVMKAAELLSAQAYLLGQAGETTALRALIPEAEALCQQLIRQDGFLIHSLVALGACTSIYANLIDACEQCGLDAEAELLRPVFERLQSIKKRPQGSEDSGADLMQKHGGMLALMMVPAVSHLGVPPPTPEEMKAGRLMNYAIVDRVFLWAAALHLLVLLPVVLVLPRVRGALPSRLGRRFAQLPSTRDWLWIIGLGILLPLAWLLATTRLTPLGCRDWSLAFFAFQPVTTQYTMAFYLLVASTACAVRWRLGVRAASLGFGPRRPAWSLVPPTTLALAIPLAGCIRFRGSETLYFVAIILASAAILWLLFLVIRALFGRRRHAPYRSAVATLLAPALALGILLILALVPLTHHAERDWLTRDELTNSSPEYLGSGRLETESARVVMARLREALNAPSNP